MRISAPSKSKQSQQLRISSASNKRVPGRRSRQSAISNPDEHSGAALAQELSDTSVTTNNQLLHQIMEHKFRTLIAHRNSIVHTPEFLDNLKALEETFESNKPEDLVALEHKLDVLEQHLDGQNQLTQRLNRTTEMLARLDREFAEYRRILEERDG